MDEFELLFDRLEMSVQQEVHHLYINHHARKVSVVAFRHHLVEDGAEEPEGFRV